ncbi:MAG TPA: zinc dependent phospholipase C family protein [Longimicrobium sp.]|nr:zinc dependent phospholipase C family protein [Longimicrobium sp.]
MPHAAIHHLLALRVLERWRDTPAAAPFEVASATRNGFLHGSLGPDMGYFPGADPLLSRLAHHARTGALCRALVAEARSEVERAYAWGWVTHVLADVAVHPLVNDACGELLRGERVPVWGESAAVTHLRVEIGLDAVYCARHLELCAIRLEPALGPSGVRFVARAFARTYGAAPAAESVLTAHRQVTRLAGPLSALQQVSARALGEAGGTVDRALRAGAALPLRVISTFCPPDSHARGLFSPVRPPAWMLAEVNDVVAGFPDWFDGHYRSNLQFLRDHCLDTGEVDPHDPPAAAAAIRELAGPARLAA